MSATIASFVAALSIDPGAWLQFGAMGILFMIVVVVSSIGWLVTKHVLEKADKYIEAQISISLSNDRIAVALERIATAMLNQHQEKRT